MPPGAVRATYTPKWRSEQDQFIFSPSPGETVPVDGVSSVEASLSDNLRFTLGSGLRRERTNHKLSMLSPILTSIVAVVVIVTWLAFCMPRRGGRKTAQLVQRHLSGRGEDSDLNSILEGCLELREELGLSQDVSEPDEPPEAKKARLFLMLRESGEAFERRQGDNSHLLPARDFGPSHGVFAHKPGQLVENSALVASKREESIFEGAIRPPASALKRKSSLGHTGNATSASSSPGAFSYKSSPSTAHVATRSTSDSRGRSGTDNVGVTPEDWILGALDKRSPQGWDQGPKGGGSPHDSQQQANPARSATDALSNRPAVLPVASIIPSGKEAVTSTSQGVYEHSAQQQKLRTARLVAENAQRREYLAHDGGASQPSNSIRDVLAKPISDAALNAEGMVLLHPFVRLPHVLPEGITQVFDGARALSSKVSVGSPMKDFTSMRELFAKSALTVADVEQLMHDCKCLIAYACKKLAGSLHKRNAFYVARKLATMFMVFDYVVSTIELLGDKMDTHSWWPQFVNRFQTNYLFERKINTQHVTEGIAALAQRLSAALAIYKTGVRPPGEIIIDLKRTIFTNLRSSCIFGHRSWIQWENDDTLFSQIGTSAQE
ncbi:hypothetical protein EMWEY_00018120 [Eimeria maxima]|uniref:Uncharacterized protein n=1 Tax=Eimeria maxima TaxID=5804 RepID=U6M8L6_EIMMA|nr:hypothetical protein EMWEY_00018120 [Eimeria maxima]CDJ58824.1 hypothetical protein EMWEY_00018120 [Eimeria maxima]